MDSLGARFHNFEWLRKMHCLVDFLFFVEGEAIAPPHPLQTVMPMYSDFGGIYTFSWIKTAVMTIIDHENIIVDTSTVMSSCFVFKILMKIGILVMASLIWCFWRESHG